MEKTHTILFVYGTLKRGLRNHPLIGDQEFLGEAVTKPRYRVFDLGPHPGLVIDETRGLAVRGELWAVSDCCLAELDDFEEVPDLFVRASISLADGRDVQAYFWNREVPAGAKSGSEWPVPSAEPGARNAE